MSSTYDINYLKVRFTFFKNYVYFITDKETGKTAIIDPSWEYNKIINMITEVDANPVMILLTHSHPDHINLVNQLLSGYDLDVYMHEKEIEYSGFNCRDLKPIKNKSLIQLGNTNIICLHTPGHTIGSTCFIL